MLYVMYSFKGSGRDNFDLYDLDFPSAPRFSASGRIDIHCIQIILFIFILNAYPGGVFFSLPTHAHCFLVLFTYSFLSFFFFADSFFVEGKKQDRIGYLHTLT